MGTAKFIKAFVPTVNKFQQPPTEEINAKSYTKKSHVDSIHFGPPLNF